MTDLLYLAWNRLEFSEQSFDLLLRNTDWSLIDRLFVYDNHSTDGTAELLRDGITQSPVEWHFIEHSLNSPVAVMNDYVERFAYNGDLFAKVDNDIAVPPGWLETMSCVIGQSPELELLGMEAGRMGDDEECYTWEPGSHIGGVGLMRTDAFLKRPAPTADGRFGFTQWQHRHDPVRGWINPDLRVCALNMIPVEPWCSLSDRYIANGWERSWPRYANDPPSSRFWNWLTEKETA